MMNMAFLMAKYKEFRIGLTTKYISKASLNTCSKFGHITTISTIPVFERCTKEAHFKWYQCFHLSKSEKTGCLKTLYMIIGQAFSYSCHETPTAAKLLFFPLSLFKTLRLRQSCRHFSDNIFKYIFISENIWISFKILLKLVPKVRINNIPALVQIMAWCQPGDKPLSEPMMISLLTHICVTRPRWVNY